MMSRGFRHLGTAVIVSILLLLFYIIFSTAPLSSLLKTNARSPLMFNVQQSVSPTAERISGNILDDKGESDDPVVIDMLRKHYLVPPSKLPYDLEEPHNINPSMGQAQAIDVILQQKRGGFFIECGGLDGETRSNTLYFEKERGWSGVVIEADPANFDEMKSKNRKAYLSPTCLATSSRPSKVVFAQNSNRGHIYDVDTYDDAPAKGFVKVQCFPLYSFILALNVTTVDYFSLDIEGAEFKVLQTIPWDKVDIKTLSVEYFHDAEGKQSIKNYMASNGYDVYTEVTHPMNLANDFIFVKRELLR